MSASCSNEVLSDVHVFVTSSKTETKTNYISRLYFQIPKGQWEQTEGGCIRLTSFDKPSERVYSNDEPGGTKELTLDEDGDFELKRNSNQTEQCSKILDDVNELNNPSTSDQLSVISIEHKMETELSDVGFQVWSGALLLCDYIIYSSPLLSGSHIVDLGAGTGITSITSAMVASCVVCTDFSTDILELAERNWLRNKDLLPHVTCRNIYFKVLDWTKDLPPKQDTGLNSYRFTGQDLHLIENSNIILAAEVIYDEELTLAFFKTIYHILSKSPPKTLLLAIEKRTVFSNKDQTVCSPAYEDFTQHLADLVSVDQGPVRFTSQQIECTFPQYFRYHRSKELELWTIKSMNALS